MTVCIYVYRTLTYVVKEVKVAHNDLVIDIYNSMDSVNFLPQLGSVQRPVFQGYFLLQLGFFRRLSIIIIILSLRKSQF